MSLEIELDVYDYDAYLGWFIKAFGKDDSATEQDKKSYQKLAVLAEQHLEDVAFIERHDKR